MLRRSPHKDYDILRFTIARKYQHIFMMQKLRNAFTENLRDPSVDALFIFCTQQCEYGYSPQENMMIKNV